MLNNQQQNTVVPVTQPNALLKAYEVNTLQYKLAYHALNVLWDSWEQNESYAQAVATELGVTTEQCYTVLEELFTFNPDPDNSEEWED